MASMLSTKTVVYILIIATIMLSLLLSMMNVGVQYEFIIAKWSICGLMSIVVTGASLVDLKYFSKDAHINGFVVIKIFTIPVIVFVFAVLAFDLLGVSDLTEKIFFQKPLLPIYLVFLVSMAVYLSYICFGGRKTGSENKIR